MGWRGRGWSCMRPTWGRCRFGSTSGPKRCSRRIRSRDGSSAARRLASVRVDRCAREEQVQFLNRVAGTTRKWDEGRLQLVDEEVKQIDTRPAMVVEHLLSVSLGCDWLMQQWQRLEQSWITDGHWKAATLTRVLRLLGQAGLPTSQSSPELVALWKNVLGASIAGLIDEFDRFNGTKSAHLEPAARLAQARSQLPGIEQARSAVLEFVREKIRWLNAERERIWFERDQPARQFSIDNNLFDETPFAANRQRYERSNSAEVHRCLSQLWKKQSMEVEESAEGESEAVPSAGTPSSAAVELSTTVQSKAETAPVALDSGPARNEATTVAEPHSNDVQIKTSGVSRHADSSAPVNGCGPLSRPRHHSGEASEAGRPAVGPVTRSGDRATTSGDRATTGVAAEAAAGLQTKAEPAPVERDSGAARNEATMPAPSSVKAELASGCGTVSRPGHHAGELPAGETSGRPGGTVGRPGHNEWRPRHNGGRGRGRRWLANQARARPHRD